ncbi:MAG: hypothetical protein CL477_15580 [Acidobacteria bacterium]|nr:hypothetical protein [Acidobacteriota bacterium]HJN45819.1 hypothetical protein [Vicinamibacterales bacterium]|tara:strand:+ start:506 stop:1576 length:1071 start_codon:yes stop_codon:yes gene_type:complete
MAVSPIEVALEISPRARVDLVDVRRRIAETHGDLLESFPRALYCSFHTTAGYLDQSLAARLNKTRNGLAPYLTFFRNVFPEGAGYKHDEMHLREELSEAERQVEPSNADSHLAFISAGLRSCVTYRPRANEPVYFIDLDGVNKGRPRQRVTTALGFNSEEEVARDRVAVPMSAHPVDSVSLKDPRFGIYERCQELIERHGVTMGRLQLSLAAGEDQAGLTVNEYETLLMRHDLAEVLRDPLRFMAEKSRHLLADPLAIPNKTIGYAKYDMVRVFNELVDALRLSDSVVEQIVSRFFGAPARHFLRMKRSVSLPVSDRETPGTGQVAQGRYQSPILVQWRRSQPRTRVVDITLTRFR